MDHAVPDKEGEWELINQHSTHVILTTCGLKRTFMVTLPLLGSALAAFDASHLYGRPLSVLLSTSTSSDLEYSPFVAFGVDS